jgi:hypothetical protein
VIGGALFIAGVATAVWSILGLPASSGRGSGLVVAAVLIVISVAAPVLSRRQRRRAATAEPTLVLDSAGFTAWGGLRVRWSDVASWEAFHHDEVYDDDDPEDHPDHIGPSRVDEILILVHVDHPEPLLRRLDPDVRAAYEDDSFGDGKRFGTPIRIGADGLDAPTDEVLAEFEHYSGMAPRERPTADDAGR